MKIGKKWAKMFAKNNNQKSNAHKKTTSEACRILALVFNIQWTWPVAIYHIRFAQFDRLLAQGARGTVLFQCGSATQVDGNAAAALFQTNINLRDTTHFLFVEHLINPLKLDIFQSQFCKLT